MARENETQAILPRIVTVPAGTTMGVYIGPIPYQTKVTITNQTSASSLIILQANSGSTYAAATLLALAATFGYNAVAFTPVVISGPAAYYLAAAAPATAATVHVMAELTNFTGS